MKSTDKESRVPTIAAPLHPVAADNLSVTLKEVSHHFGTRPVFNKVSMQVKAGQVGVITGSNGSGKSTLLKIVAGLLTPSSGETTVSVDGVSLDTQARRVALGYVSPDLTLYKELTGAENLFFFARLRGRTLSLDAMRALLAEVGLRGRGRDLVGSYSSGMRQRLKYAYALLARPPILILDEPTANLDVDGMAIVEQVVAAQRERTGGGLTIIGTNEPREVTGGDLVVRLESVS